MFVAKASKWIYVGFKHDRHEFTSLDGSTTILAKVAKIVKDADTVLFCSGDGQVKPTYNTVRRRNKEESTKPDYVRSDCG